MWFQVSWVTIIVPTITTMLLLSPSIYIELKIIIATQCINENCV